MRTLLLLEAVSLALCCVVHPVSAAGSDAARTTEQLPVDRFDEYTSGALPPPPWPLAGVASPHAIPAKSTRIISQEAESPFPANKITGKGLLMRRTARAAGAAGGGGGDGPERADIGIMTTFTPPPPGDVYLGFDFRIDGAPLDVALTDTTGRGLHLRIDPSGGGASITTRDGSREKTAALEERRWYHIGITISGPDDSRTAVLRLFDERNKTRPPANTPPTLATSVLLPASAPFTVLRFGNPPASVPAPSAEDSAAVSWMLDNICVAGEVAAPRASGWFPFDPAPVETMRGSPRKVFAYYYPPYPTDRKTDDTGLSNYILTTLNPSSPVDARRKGAGTKVFYHPLPRPPFPADAALTPAEQRIRAAGEDVRLAIRMGADGFVVDLHSWPKPDDHLYNERAFAVLAAAGRIDAGFKILPAIYSGSGLNTIRGEADAKVDPRKFAASPVFKKLDASPNILRTPDGKMLFSQWLSERHSPAWWRTVMDELAAQGIPAAFVAHFNSTLQLPAFGPMSHGIAHWGPRSPVTTNWIQTARPHTPLVIAPVSPHDIRSRGNIYREAANFDTLRTTWRTAIDQQADWVFINTWSDHTEQAMVPSTAIGFAPYDLCAWYTQWFKLGAPPPIVRDVLYYSYRKNHTDLIPAKGAPWNLRRDGGMDAPRNDIELLAFLKKPGEIQIVFKGQTHTRQADAGITSFKVPLPPPAPGEAPAAPVFRLLRNGNPVIDAPGRVAILNEADYANLLYHSGVLVASDKS
jgi:hypothetical protein